MTATRSLTLHIAELLGAAALFYVGLYPPKATADPGCKSNTTCNVTTTAGQNETGTCTGTADEASCLCDAVHVGPGGGHELAGSSDCNPPKSE